MALEVDHVLIAVGVIVVGAFLANQAFKRWRMPEALLLIGLGMLLGPVASQQGLPHVDIDFFLTISPLVGAVAIIMILFDGGLEIRLADLKTGVAAGSGLAVLVFAATTVLCAGIAYVLLHASVSNSILLGMAFGGAGAVIVIPLIRQLGVKPESVTVVSLEAAVSDVLVIVGIYGMCTALTTEGATPEEFAVELVKTFALAIFFGIALGYLWATILSNKATHGYGYVLTLGVLFLMYVALEHIHASGPIAVLAFGLVIGNRKTTREFVQGEGRRPGRKPGVLTIEEPVFGETLAHFHHEAVFLVRSFFFVGLGVVLDLSVFADSRFLIVGFLLAVAVAVARWWGVKLLFFRNRLPAWDKHAISLMFPLGLAAAALSQVPHQQFAIEGTELFSSYAAVVIVLTNLMSAVMVWWSSRPENRKKFDKGPPMPVAKSTKAGVKFG